MTFGAGSVRGRARAVAAKRAVGRRGGCVFWEAGVD